MSNDYINIRIFSWHFHLNFDWKMSIGKNTYHKEKNWPDGYFRIYQFFN